jgi:probable HAF family extracellular repeat protein
VHSLRIVFPPLKLSVRIACTTLMVFSFAQAQTSYKLRRIPTLGGNFTQAYGMNDSGLVVGSSDFPETPYSNVYSHAFIWSRVRGGIRDLGTFGGLYSIAYAINNSGQVVGEADGADGESPWGHAFLWAASTGKQDLGTLGGSLSVAFSINNNGQAVGWSTTSSDSPRHAFLWTQGTMQDLGTLGGSYSEAWSINDNGQVVGQSELPDQTTHAFLWTASGGMQDLGTLGGPYSAALAINNSGVVVGESSPQAGVFDAFYLTSAGGMQILNTSPGVFISTAKSINSAGQVVGAAAVTGATTTQPFLWTQAGGTTTLGSFGSNKIVGADFINGTGQMLATRFIQGPRRRGNTSYLLTPVFATTTSVNSSPNPAAYPASVTFTATVIAGGAAAPTGSVSFMDGTTRIGTVRPVNGVATLTKHKLSVGTHAITAQYLGDYASDPSASTVLNQVIQ